MLANRQLWSGLVIADVVLFLIASAFNDHSSTSFDGIIWWVAIAGFGLLLVFGCVVLIGFLRSRARRPRWRRARR